LTTTLPCGARTFLGVRPTIAPANRSGSTAERRGRPTDSSATQPTVLRRVSSPGLPFARARTCPRTSHALNGADSGYLPGHERAAAGSGVCRRPAPVGKSQAPVARGILIAVYAVLLAWDAYRHRWSSLAFAGVLIIMLARLRGGRRPWWISPVSGGHGAEGVSSHGPTSRPSPSRSRGAIRCG